MLFGAGRHESRDDFADQPLAPAMVRGERARKSGGSRQDNAARASERIVARNLDIEPTLTVRPGWPVRAIVTEPWWSCHGGARP